MPAIIIATVNALMATVCLAHSCINIEPGKMVRICHYFWGESSTEIKKDGLNLYQAISLLFEPLVFDYLSSHSVFN